MRTNVCSSRLVWFVFSLFDVSVLVGREIYCSGTTFLIRGDTGFVRDGQRTTFFRVGFFQYSGPRRVFSPFDGNLSIGRVFCACILECKITAPKATTRDRKQGGFRIMGITSATLEE